jgi:site-specific DNA-methyltransferase (adenine-specific)
MKGVYRWLPQQEWNQDWTDEALYKKYGITKAEIAFINRMVRAMGENKNDE